MKYVAFLRAVNVGSHVVKMEELRRIFESLGHANVETFIASGNVVFDSTVKKTSDLERKIESKLHKELGYEVGTFIRTIPELVEVARCTPLSNTDATIYVAFLRERAGKEPAQKILSLSNQTDELKFHEREFYWLCRKSMTESKFSYALLEKTLKSPATFRNVNTIRRIVAKYKS